MSSPVVAQVSNITVQLDQSEVLRDVDLTLRSGEFLALLGSNGSGKSTLVRTMLGLVAAVCGEVRLFGTELGEFKQWGRIGYVPQRFGVVSGVPATVEEVALSGRIAVARRFRAFGRADRDAARVALKQVALADLATSRVSRLSGGQQQRVMIARALVNHPDLLVLDEPSSNLDLVQQDRLADLLADLQSGGTAVVLVAHTLGAMEALVDRALVLEAGRVVHDGAPLPEHQHDHVHHHRRQEPLGGTGAEQHRVL